MTEFKLRSYQTEAIDAAFKAWQGGMTRPAIVLPTGAGKTVVFSHLINRFRAKQTGPLPQLMVKPEIGSRVIVLVHRDELADQAIAKLRAVAPDLNVGKVKALDNNIIADVMVCSVQTLASARRRDHLRYGEVSHGKIGLIITDECHHAAAASYKKVYDSFPDALQLGVTATMARGDGVGLGSVWEDVVYERSILWMIKEGYLVDVKAQQVQAADIDLGAVKTSRGDYQAGDLGRMMMESHAEGVISRAYLEHAKDRQGIVFTPTVETAKAACDSLNDAGIPSAFISGDTPADMRRTIYSNFRIGNVQALVNCMVLTEGFDAPWASCAVIARPTQSAPLYTQMVGRVLRTHPGKEDALVLDLVGASTSNKLRTLIDLEPGAVQSMRPGETLEEAVEREENEQPTPSPGQAPKFALKVRHVSMFDTSSKAWLQTRAGVRFISCGDVTVFLWPAGENWDVCMAPRRADRAMKWERTEHRGLDLARAMLMGELVAEDHQAFSLEKRASWRRSKASDAQIRTAENMGITGTEKMNKGEVSAAIDIVMKSRLFDRYALNIS